LRFRPCIDLRDGRVVQIVGGSLSEDKANGLVTNFETDLVASAFARMYREDNLTGGHVISLGRGNHDQAISALKEFPGGMQYGGGVTDDNAKSYLDSGASHVIVTSHIFQDGEVNYEKLSQLKNIVSRKRLVIDLSCRKQGDDYWVVMDRWQTFTKVKIEYETVNRLAEYCDEFLVHGVDVEGRQTGVEYQLVDELAGIVPIPVTYAGGASQLTDLDNVRLKGHGKIDLTIGSALDIFGGSVKYSDVVAWQRDQNRRQDQ
jgi:phosphoribosylformimino-5-aminoimidazole carboxamide ribotide isomerase